MKVRREEQTFKEVAEFEITIKNLLMFIRIVLLFKLSTIGKLYHQ